MSNVKFSALKVKKDRDKKSRLYPINFRRINKEYNPFVSYCGDIKYDANINNIDFSQLRNKNRIDLRKTDYKGRAIVDEDTNEILLFEDPEKIRKHQNLELLEQFNHLNEDNIITPDIKIKIGESNSEEHKLAVKCFKDLIDINDIQNNLDNLIKNMIITDSNLFNTDGKIRSTEDINISQRLYVQNSCYTLVSSPFRSNFKRKFIDNINLGKIGSDILNDKNNLDRNIIHKYFNIVKSNSKYDITKFKHRFRRVNNFRIYNHIKPRNNKLFKNKFSFRLDDGINPDEWDYEVIDPAEYYLRMV